MTQDNLVGLDITEQEALAIAESPAPESPTMEIQYVAIDELLKMMWEDNPKEHNKPLISSAITDYGYLDAIGADLNLKKIVYGHGRLEDLEGRMARNENLPRYIKKREDGMWLVPVTPLAFDDLTQLYRAALMHNRAGVGHFDARNYNQERMRRALSAARAPQLALPGFGGEEVNKGAWAAAQIQMSLPALPAFDSVPFVHESPQEVPLAVYVIIVTSQSRDAFREMIELLSLHTQSDETSHTKRATINGDEFLVEYRKLLASPPPAGKRRSHHKKKGVGRGEA
jgi:hypothetical protein